jgi:hypothetical protein
MLRVARGVTFATWAALPGRKLEGRRYRHLMYSRGWIVTIDTAYPAGVTEITDEAIDRFLDSIASHRGALNLGPAGHRGITVTLSLSTEELDDATSMGAAARGEAIVREKLNALGIAGTWGIGSIEVLATDQPGALHLLPVTRIKAAA